MPDSVLKSTRYQAIHIFLHDVFAYYSATKNKLRATPAAVQSIILVSRLLVLIHAHSPFQRYHPSSWFLSAHGLLLFQCHHPPRTPRYIYNVRRDETYPTGLLRGVALRRVSSAIAVLPMAYCLIFVSFLSYCLILLPRHGGSDGWLRRFLSVLSSPLDCTAAY